MAMISIYFKTQNVLPILKMRWLVSLFFNAFIGPGVSDVRPNCRMAASLAELNGVLHVCGGFNGREARLQRKPCRICRMNWELVVWLPCFIFPSIGNNHPN